ncbi:gamma-glutamyl-gamma-aminobutyrate hydrolase family protein [Candidatus Neoehrlichia procyonis]|uniref:Peptidase C26 family protein n=1 Tax=Candidatus Neoehrlichia procyonis str. RAC413 TaxID=1359163 RepID=A0A0F3NQ01_9RICK|nr:gamma-glutamyl-gamma-aminobutyrate hydrolase family protein [Candidatus Neoehrlichia lotoris]KJV68994.1 peptidase C26 family protein [Candidatus Neoehrlichia lotoris str. RAC413]
MKIYTFNNNKASFFLIIVLFLFLLLPCQQSVCANLKNTPKNNVIVGILSTSVPSYPTEYQTAVKISKIFNDKGIKVILIDYNKIIKFARELNNCDVEISNQSIDYALQKFISDNNINRILIPGNKYNISSSPLSPSPNRQLVTSSIAKVVRNNPKIHLLAICGGIQGVMHAQGILVNRVDGMLQSQDSASVHVISLPDPTSKNANLKKVIIDSNSRLAYIINKVSKQQSSKIITYFPDVHHEAINNNSENIDKMHALGYKIAAMSEDGMIEVIEDKNNNILLQMHPEYLLMNSQEKLTDNHRKKAIMIANIIFDDFLYRS